MSANQGANLHGSGDVEDLDVEDRVHEFTQDELGPDELYDLRREMVDAGEMGFAVRVDVEYRNSLRYDDYWPAFGPEELTNLLIVLGNMRYHHVAAGNRRRADIVGDLADLIAQKLRDWSDEYGISIEDYVGISMPSDDDVERDHSDRMERAKHNRDAEEITVEASEGELDEDDVLDEASGPSAAEEKEINPQPQTPDTPDGPTGENGGDDPEAG